MEIVNLHIVCDGQSYAYALDYRIDEGRVACKVWTGHGTRQDAIDDARGKLKHKVELIQPNEPDEPYQQILRGILEAALGGIRGNSQS